MNPNAYDNVKWGNPERDAKRRASIAASWQRSEESLQKLSQSCRASWTPERRAKHSEMVKARPKKKIALTVQKNLTQVKKEKPKIKSERHVKAWTPERRAAKSEMMRSKQRKLDMDSDAYLQKLRREGFSPQEIENLLLTGRAS